MNNNNIAPHEILELHELLSASLVEIKMLSNSMSMIQDESLKAYIKDSINNKKSRIQELQNFINNSIGSQVSQANQDNQNNSST